MRKFRHWLNRSLNIILIIAIIKDIIIIFGGVHLDAFRFAWFVFNVLFLWYNLSFPENFDD